MAERWLIESGDRGPRLVMRGPWSQAALKALKGGGVKELELNYAKGWEGDAYSFLHQLTQLEALELTDWNAEDVSAIKPADPAPLSEGLHLL